jgi:caffeoyl-CoA O-methyltransferase
MSKNPLLANQVDHYITEIISRETKIQRSLREETAKLRQRAMQTTPDQVAFLAMLVKITGAKRILEIGTFTGYSALAMGMALPEGGKIVCCDVSKAWADIAQRYWQEAGILNRIDLRLAPAIDTLTALLKQGMASSFDMAFIDADKTNYDDYYEACLKLVKTGGIIALDNMLWGGSVVDPSEQDEFTVALRNLNTKIRDDERVEICLLTVADGIMLVRKQ